jgi:ribosomal protein S18 acetylase RimI-like enzyme
MSAEQVSIRRAGPEDAAAIARLLHDFNAEYSEPTPGVEALTEYSRRLLERGEMTVLLAGGGPGGISLIRFRPCVWTGGPEAHLQELYVVPSLRGQGIGRKLLETALETARNEGATHMELGTSEDDTAARALYESAGFTNREGSPDGPVMLFYEREL